MDPHDLDGHKRIDETMRYVHFAGAYRRLLPQAIIEAGHDEPEPEKGSSRCWFKGVAAQACAAKVRGEARSMGLAFKHDDIPLTTTTDGAIVVTGTRVSLDLIVSAFASGATAEEVAQQYPTVQLADATPRSRTTCAHRDDVDAYLAHRREQAEQVRAENERRLDPGGVRDRLLARMASTERDRVADQDHPRSGGTIGTA